MTETSASSDSPGVLPCLIAIGSFVPLLGVPLGLIAIVWGIIKRRHGGILLIVSGTLGILFTVLLYGLLFYKGFVERGGIYDKLRVEMAQTALNNLLPRIEYYKVLHGSYPQDLKALLTSDGSGEQAVLIYDPFFRFGDQEIQVFNYDTFDERSAYYLFSSGADGKPGTADDIYPEVSMPEGAASGYVDLRD